MGAAAGALELNELTNELTAALLAAAKAAGVRPPEHFALTVPPQLEHGHLTTDLALRLTDRSRPATAWAEEIRRQLKLPATIATAQVAGAGFLNFTLNDRGWSELVAAWLSGSPLHSDRQRGRRVIIDYSSPNIAKPFTVGHLRSTILGEATARANEAVGATVIRSNYLGDWGTQFGKLLVALDRWGDATTLTDDPINKLLSLYVRFHREAESDPELTAAARATFVRLEQGDPDTRRRWQELVDVSLAEFKRLYERLNIRFDQYRGESYYLERTEPVLEELRHQGLVKESEGALVLVWPDDELPTTVLRKSDGATVYLLRDLAALHERLTESQAEAVIYHVGSDQSLHFRQLIRAASLLGWLNRRPDGRQPTVLAAHHGLYRLPEGKMSTRQGRGVLFDDLLAAGLEQAKTLIKTKEPAVADDSWQTLAEILALGALKYNDLAHHRLHDIVFSWDQALNLEGNSAPYLMYTHARVHGLFRQANLKLAEFDPAPTVAGRLDQPAERQLLLLAWPLRQSLFTAATEATPHVIADQLYRLASLFNSYYGATRIITEDQELTTARLALAKGVALTLAAGLNILGIDAPEEL